VAVTAATGYSPAAMTTGWPITIADVLQARRRLKDRLPPTPLRCYAALDEAVGHGIRLYVKHENHNPTQSFKARNALAAMTMLSAEEQQRGVVGATRGNHGAGLAWAGQLLHIPVTICVPVGNNPEKNEAMRGFGATLIEEGQDYEAAVKIADQLVREKGMTLVHSTNNRNVIAGAATMTLEMIAQQPMLDALVLAVGGGSQAVGALTVARAMRPGMEIHGVQAAEAAAAHDSWHAKERRTVPSANTFADGLATRSTYDFTFDALLEGLTGFVKVTEAEIAEALRLYIRTTHNLAEGAAAAGLAGLFKLRAKLAGKSVGVCLSGSNIDSETLRRVVCGEL
jgi:threonine dehydratase